MIDNIPELTYQPKAEKKFNPCFIPPEYLPIYQTIAKHTIDANRLSKVLKMPIQEINSILFMLELGSYIEKLPGGEYRVKEE